MSETMQAFSKAARKLHKFWHVILKSTFSTPQVKLSYHRRVIALGNSIAITLLQHNLYDDAVYVLQLVVEADRRLDDADQLRKERVVTSCVFSCLEQRIGNLVGALKFLHDAQRVVMSLADTCDKSEVIDYQVQTYLLTFLSLWKMKEYPEARKYIQNLARKVKVHLKTHTDLLFLRKNVIYAVVIMCLLGIAYKCKLQEDMEKALLACKDYLGKARSIQIALCLRLMISKIESKARRADDVLVTAEFEKLLFMALFLPFVQQEAPTARDLRLLRARFGREWVRGANPSFRPTTTCGPLPAATKITSLATR